jgi:CDP-6-deoxy-D-xylo-4-hexulose-3-dehydrase
MNIERISRIRTELDALMSCEIEANPSRYWYPLSLPTYGSDEILEALDTMCTFKTSMAEKTVRFERRFAEYQGCADAVMVNSGSSADLLLGLLLTNPLRPRIEAGDEVIVPVVTWPTQIWSMMMAGLKVRLVDVDPATLNINLDDLDSVISSRTRALFLVHLMGNPCSMDRVLQLAGRHELHIIEDCCEAMGALWDGTKVGNFGLGGAFSFFFSHHITTMEGGMIAVNDGRDAEQLRLLRAHGWVRNVDPGPYELHRYPEVDERYAFVNWGLNVRPTEVQAGFGLHQIERAEAFADQRAQQAARFSEFLSRRTRFLSLPRVDPKAVPSWLALPLMVRKDAPFSRSGIIAHLEREGIETRPIVAGNLARQPVAERFPELRARTFQGADEIHRRGFYIGLSPVQPNASMDRLLDVFDRFLRNY